MAMNQISVQAVVFGWAGTTVDYGSMASVVAFTEAFRRQQVEVSTRDIRRYMGMDTRDQLRNLLSTDSVKDQWFERFGRYPAPRDLEIVHADFRMVLKSTVIQRADPIPGVVETTRRLREQGIRIGSSTGYNSEVMDQLVPAAADAGYLPDVVVTVDAVLAGRPAPFMCYLNAVKLGVYPLQSMVKVGDTVPDIEEGANAGMWSVGVVLGSSELGLCETEVATMAPELLEQHVKSAEQRFVDAGADYVVRSIEDVELLLAELNERLAEGDAPALLRERA